MLDISNTHPFAACASFAAQLLACLAEYDFDRVESMIDANDSGESLAAQFPPPEGFAYRHPDRIGSMVMRIYNAGEKGLQFEFEVPFEGTEYRPMQARFVMIRKGKHLEVRLEGMVPS